MATALVVLLTLVVVARPAMAAGFDLPLFGARALGRGGAFVASADDLTALLHNPAGLALRSSPRLLAETTIAARHAGFERQQPGSVSPEVDDRAGVQAAPFLAGAVPSGWPLLMVSVGYFDLGSQRVAYPPDPAALPRYDPQNPTRYDPQRYTAIDAEIGRRGLALAVAARPLPWLAVGASVQLLQVRAVMTRALWAGLVPANSFEDPSLDIIAGLDARNLAVPSGNFGLLLLPHPCLAIGLALQLPASAPLRGRVSLARRGSGLPGESGAFRDLQVQGGETSLDLDYPLEARAGVRVRLGRADLEADFAFTRSSSFGAPTARLDGAGLTLTRYSGQEQTFPLRRLDLAMRLRDTFAVRLGAEASVLRGSWGGLQLSAGYSYERAATEAADLGAAFPDLDRHGLSVGLGVNVAGVRVQLGYAHLFQPAVSVVDGRQMLINPIDPGAAGTHPVGDGQAHGSWDLVALGVAVDFDEIREQVRRARPRPETPEEKK